MKSQLAAETEPQRAPPPPAGTNPTLPVRPETRPQNHLSNISFTAPASSGEIIGLGQFEFLPPIELMEELYDPNNPNAMTFARD